VIGGGMLGMTLAWRLRRQGHAVTVFEAAPRPGGLASAWRLGDVTWDRFYHVILMSDLHVRGLLEELELADRLQWRNTKTGFFTDGQLYSMSDTLEFLRFPPLGLVDKLRLGGTIFYASKLRDPVPLEQVPVAEWLRRLSGQRTFEKIWLPLLRAKLGDNYRHASAAFIWTTIARMYAARRTGLKKEMFGYVEGGYAVILERFEERLRAAGVELVCDARVQQVRPGVEVQLEGGRRVFDAAVLTVPSPVVTRLCPDLGPTDRRRLDRVAYQGIVCASLLIDEPLADYYVTNITEDWVPFTAVIEMGALVDRSTFGGRSLVYLPRYLTQDDPFWERDDDSIRETFLAALERMYPRFRRDHVRAFQVARARHVLALPTLGYSTDTCPFTETTVPGVYVANSAQIVNGTLNNNETVALAEAKAEALGRLLARR
jgi:protoporphyrinogen oxidase